MRESIFTTFLVALSLFIYGQDNIDYIRTKNFKRISLTLEDFQHIVNSIQYYFKETPKDSTDKYDKASFKCELTGKDKALAFSSFSQMENFKIESGNFNSATIRYSWDKKPISSVNIELMDYYRKLSITGSDEKKVDALYRDITEQLDAKTVFLSSINLPLIFGTLAILLFSICFSILIHSLEKVLNKKRDRQTIILFVISLIIFTTSIIYFFSSYEIRDFFPGFQLSSDTSTWWDRNQSLIGFLSFIGVIITFIVKSFKKIWYTKKT